MQIKRNQIRKGMVMVDSSLNPYACWEFEGEILVLHHPTTISAKYQAMGENITVVVYLIYFTCTIFSLVRHLFIDTCNEGQVTCTD